MLLGRMFTVTERLPEGQVEVVCGDAREEPLSITVDKEDNADFS